LKNVLAQSPFDWPRDRRANVALTKDIGVYALFLSEGATLPGLLSGEKGLLYIGLASGQDGFWGRCHFAGRTRNHSPRKSLAVLLMDELALAPVLIQKKSATWGLTPDSDARLTAWMHDSLEFAFEVCADPDRRETELVECYAPPLNLDKCAQSPQHQRISAARAQIMSRLRPLVGKGRARREFPLGLTSL
jgi:hypothetical protein